MCCYDTRGFGDFDKTPVESMPIFLQADTGWYYESELSTWTIALFTFLMILRVSFSFAVFPFSCICLKPFLPIIADL